MNLTLSMKNYLQKNFFSDVVFFIFLYQRWIYRVDPTRVNEFGYAAEPTEDQAQPIEENKSKDDKKND